uniref:Secreted protein n=1 Tax=Arundo donax TaxID=35708 RepID=A0A0A9AIM8_ARUDO
MITAMNAVLLLYSGYAAAVSLWMQCQCVTGRIKNCTKEEQNYVGGSQLCRSFGTIRALLHYGSRDIVFAPARRTGTLRTQTSRDISLTPCYTDGAASAGSWPRPLHWRRQIWCLVHVD